MFILFYLIEYVFVRKKLKVKSLLIYHVIKFIN